MLLKQIKNSFVLFLILFFFSCKEEEGVQAKFYYQYFPTNVGNWVEYDVVYIEIDEASGVYDTSKYQLKEIIESTFIDNQGRPSLRIERYWRTSDTLDWTIKDVWYATRTTTHAEKIEEDIRYKKLVFPVKEGEEWNGNIFNTLSATEYEMENVHDGFIAGSLSFDSSVYVNQRFNYNLIEEDEAYEVYAANVGLIQKLDTYFYIQNFPSNPQYVGYYFYQTVTAYGN